MRTQIRRRAPSARMLWNLMSRSRDDRGSLAMLMVVMIVGMGLALLMLPLVITQTGTTTFDAGRGRELQAAESGLDIGVGMIRAGRPTELSPGEFAKLPCPSTAVSGTLGGAGMSYTASFTYYPENPVEESAGWQAANQITWDCGANPDDPAFVAATDSVRYVLIAATGKDSSTGRSRTLTATYVLGISGVTTVTSSGSTPPPPDGSEWPPGTDQIRLADSNLCVTAWGKNVVPTLESCSDPSLLDQQRFMVTPDGYIQLISRSLCLKSLGQSTGLTTGTCTGNSWIRYPGFPKPTLLISFDSSSQYCLQASPPAPGTQVNVTLCAPDTSGTPDQWWITNLRPWGPGTDPGTGGGTGGNGSGGTGGTTTTVPYIAVWPGLQDLGEN